MTSSSAVLRRLRESCRKSDKSQIRRELTRPRGRESESNDSARRGVRDVRETTAFATIFGTLALDRATRS